MPASQTIAFSRLILPLMQNLLPFAHHQNQSYLSPSLLTKLSNPDATIVLQYMVVYQCVLATVMPLLSAWMGLLPQIFR